ncbi:hypothetical protein MARA_01090 (plasmid) [Mycolicibacterium arabiense]|uniref:Uncharacterized protein n=1 Tax=Mycolicibacterium arabiense TaxID=1286181 RepID=A0A7I7RRQ9_9MYCO|nr:hypothetical protein [Mycolicibacterium arabiense]MCV7372000.1 hypothetical protein [Mycolicibacterium arabiense]BBY46679.1 hypothetical protein MARA_01090 [Mycolicibacterium arabiense]
MDSNEADPVSAAEGAEDSANSLLAALDARIASAVSRIDSETGLGVSFDARC